MTSCRPASCVGTRDDASRAALMQRSRGAEDDVDARVALNKRGQLSGLERVGRVLESARSSCTPVADPVPRVPHAKAKLCHADAPEQNLRFEHARLTSKVFCIWPRPNTPRSPPERALEQSLSVLAILANSAARLSAGRACSVSRWAWIWARASGRVRVMVGWGLAGSLRLIGEDRRLEGWRGGSGIRSHAA